MSYGPLPEHVADLWWPRYDGSPADTGAAPLVVVIHGGFWRSVFDRHHTGPQCVGLAEAGYAVASVDYRGTGGGGGWPGTFDDVSAAVDAVPRLVAAAAEEAGVAVDVSRVVLVGHSAGGHLAAWAVTVRRTGVVGVVSLGGVLDLGQAWSLGLDPGPGGTAVDALLGGGPQALPDRYAAADPVRLGPPTVPVVAVHGTVDDRVPHSLSETYCRVHEQRLVLLPGVEHFAPIDPLSAAWPAVLGAVGELIAGS